MKMSKKWFSVILVMALSMGLIAPVSAEQITGSREKTTEATVTIKDGELELVSATGSIDFGVINFSFDEDLTATSSDSIVLNISDNRVFAESHSWDLEANLTGFTGLGKVQIKGVTSNNSESDGFVVADLELLNDGKPQSITKVTRSGKGTTGQGISTITYQGLEFTVTEVPSSGSESIFEPDTTGVITWTLLNTGTATGPE